MGADELRGKVALVTGAGRGIGLATAAELARLGAGLVLIDRELTADALTLLSSVSEDGRTAVGKRIDLADKDTPGLLQKLIARLPPVDILVNNAGWLRTRPFLEVSLEEWRRHFDINLTGMFLVTQAVLSGMIEGGSGRIINVSSELALTGAADYVAYAASKGGVIGFTKALAREVAPLGIRVNSVAPGPTVTRMLTEMTDEHTEENRLTIPARRFGTADDIARSIAFLAGPGGENYVGQVLSPNGGVVI